jgi:two-component system cell cycle sensor histidine kinase/response regulator CckA
MPTILVVDDRPENREYLVALLSHANYRVLEAADGVEALDTARSEHPDLIVADILMPSLNGFELVRQLREDPAIAKIPVIFWTAHYHEREAQALARSCGVTRVITKASEPETVLDAVQAALGSAPPPPSTPANEEFDHDRQRLLTDKVMRNTPTLGATNDRLSVLVELNLQLTSELDLCRFAAELRSRIAPDHWRPVFDHRDPR